MAPAAFAPPHIDVLAEKRVAAGRPTGSWHGYLLPPIIQPAEIARILYLAGWHDPVQLQRAVATALAECNGYSGSYCEDMDSSRVVVQRDNGLMQIATVPAQFGSRYEQRLRADPAFNAAEAFKLWRARGWQPWASNTTGVYLNDTYQLRALIGVLNWTAERAFETRDEFPDWKQRHTLTVPVLSVPQARKLYPQIPL